MVIFSQRALDRAAERFPNLNIKDEFERATFRLTTKERKHVRAQCEENVVYCSRIFMDRYMRKTREGIIFVITPSDKGEVVVTVFPSVNYLPEKQES